MKSATQIFQQSLTLNSKATNNTMSYSGIIEADWNALIETVQNEIHNFLGPDALLYAEPWTKARKFEFRFETYVMNHK